MLLAAVLLAATVARAQDDYNPNRAHEGWYYGVTVGLNVANMAKEEGGDALVRTNGGVFGGYRVGRFLAVQAELLYSGSGTSMYIDRWASVTTSGTSLSMSVTSRARSM